MTWLLTKNNFIGEQETVGVAAVGSMTSRAFGNRRMHVAFGSTILVYVAFPTVGVLVIWLSESPKP
jgi:hypothetical protein